MWSKCNSHTSVVGEKTSEHFRKLLGNIYSNSTYTYPQAQQFPSCKYISNRNVCVCTYMHKYIYTCVCVCIYIYCYQKTCFSIAMSPAALFWIAKD